MANLFNLMQQAQQMQGKLQQLQDDLARRVVSASAGAGLVTVECDGKGQIRRVRLDPSVVNPADIEMLEDLIAVAAAEAQKKAAEEAQAEMGRLTGGLDLPFKLPF
jgi:DNA-binding YbaB/EbfC family protein